MKSHFFLLLFFLSTITFGQEADYNKINFSASLKYIEIAKKIQNGNPIDSTHWADLFSSTPYALMLVNGVLDTSEFKIEMTAAYSSPLINYDSLIENDLSYHYDYKKKLPELELYINKLANTNIIDSVKKILNPFLPIRLQADGLFPQIFYFYYGPDATVIGGIVLNDLLLSYKSDSYKFGLLSAHESFHAITIKALWKRLNLTEENGLLNLLFLLNNINQEGIADLIDKDILEHPDSPVYEEFILLKTNDSNEAVKYIRQIDSLFILGNKSDTVWKQFTTLQQAADAFGRNGGHMPGRFMGSVIQEGKTLEEHMQNVEDPISFFTCYNKAVERLGNKKYPLFSDETIDYLEKMRKKLYKE